MKRHQVHMFNRTRLQTLLVCLSLLSLVVSGCGSKPSQDEITALVSQHHDTTRADKWSLIKVTSVEVGKAVKNNGIVAQEPNDTEVYPVTVLLNESTRGWRNEEVQNANVRDEYVFAKNSTGKWVSHKVRSQAVGQSRTSEEQWLSSSDEVGFDKDHLAILKDILEMHTGRDAKDLLHTRQLLITYIQLLTENKTASEVGRIKLIAEVLEAFEVKLGNTAQAYQAGEGGPQSPKSPERTQWSQDIVTLGEFMKNPGFQGTRKLWEQFKAKR